MPVEYKQTKPAVIAGFVCFVVRIQNHFFLNRKATFTRAIITGTSTNGPITAANASPELIPKMAIATAMANSKLLLAAVNDRVVDCAYVAPTFLLIKNEPTNIIIK